MTPATLLERGLSELGLELPSGGRDRLLQYLELLAKWNRTYNLTAVREPRAMVSHHLLDSLVVIPHLPMQDGALADVGSGAGVPGIPLAIAQPQWRVTLNDASEKKAAFLRQAVMELGLRNVAVHQGRVEAWRPAGGGFAVVISRAFAQLARFIASCRHLARPGGVLAAMTGAAPADSGGEVIALSVPLLNAARHLVLYHVEG